MSAKKIHILAASLLIATLWGCTSNYESTGEPSYDLLASAAKVGMDNCLTCHNPGSTLLQDYMISRHGNRMLAATKALPGFLNDALEVPGDDPSPDHCGHCHPTNDSDIDFGYIARFEDPLLTNWWDDSLAGVPLIGCEECHGGGQFHNGIAAGIPYPVPGPKQCGQCHYLNDAIANPEWVLEGEYPHHTYTRGGLVAKANGSGVRRNILDSHVDNPATSYVSELACDISKPETYDLSICAPNVVEGYALRYSQQNGCVDCHFEGHKMDLTKNYQWAASGHAAGIKTLKDAALAAHNIGGTTYDALDEVMLADVTATGPDEGETFPHYDWDDSASRGSCQMCHTATGAMNFLNDPANYNADNNDFSHLAGWTADHKQSGQNELLYCWACHSDSDGNLRNPGAITLAYTVDGVKPTLPDLGDSNVCINCHSGRGNMDSLIGTATANPAGAAVTGGTKTHYMAAGAMINQSLTRIGYEYAGQSYTDPPYYAHDGLGCAECHMTAASHSLEVVEKTAGVITAIEATKCVECHDGEHALFVAASQVGETIAIWDGAAATPRVVLQADADAAAAELETEAEEYTNALAALAAALTTAGTPPKAGYPYFTGSSTDQGHGGAMHNYGLLIHEPGAYAHNRFYTKRLIFDSIDWLSSGAAGSRALDGSITLNTVTYAGAIAWLGGDAGTGVTARP